jgi:hypothetical protein
MSTENNGMPKAKDQQTSSRDELPHFGEYAGDLQDIQAESTKEVEERYKSDQKLCERVYTTLLSRVEGFAFVTDLADDYW